MIPNLQKSSNKPKPPTASNRESRQNSNTSQDSATTTSATTNKYHRWDNFDYHQHWYPVIWECDLPEDKPTQVTLFDVDYVVARTRHNTNKNGNADDTSWTYTALQDRCPHKAAALSEGRITSSGFLQCAYHGWSFDGTSGECVQIPQAAANAKNDKGGGVAPARACAKAIPLQVHQGMVWLWPGPEQKTYPKPPTIPEMDMEGWTSIPVVRDFPCVDWSLLLSNILDPDHGCFAHTQLAFDFYSANTDHPMDIEETFEDDNNGSFGWKLESKVDSVEKLLKADQAKREKLGLKTRKSKKRNVSQPPQKLTATSVFHAPTTVGLCRRDENGETKFITAFWVTPVGTGRSRFMTAAVFPRNKKFPFKPPRWALTMSLNRFLDQDTVLVASQQPPILTAEAMGVEKPRASLFTYGSASDKSVRLIDQFWDATLSKAPNRQSTLQQLSRSGQLQHTPPREQVLDRKTQHLDICPDSQGFVRNCRALRNGSIGVVAARMFQALWQRALPKSGISLLILATGIAWVTDQLQRQYFFCKTAASRDKDLKKIPLKAWLDL